MSEAEKVIEKLKARFRVETDSDLAERLLVSRSTVANWRNRNAVPARYSRIADGEANWAAWSRPLGELSDIERAAMQLAALRLVRDFADIATDYRIFLNRGTEAALAFNKYWHQACVDLVAAVDERNSDHPADTVAQIIAYNEVFAPK